MKRNAVCDDELNMILLAALETLSKQSTTSFFFVALKKVWLGTVEVCLKKILSPLCVCVGGVGLGF